MREGQENELVVMVLYLLPVILVMVLVSLKLGDVVWMAMYNMMMMTRL